jgi:carboxyl-terminal processing protease
MTQSVIRLVAFTAGVAAAASLGIRASAQQDWRPTALLSFDTAWQTINETYFDPAFGGLDWNGVRSELRPKVETASSPEAARAILRDMIGRLKQSHFVLLSSASAADTLPGEAIVPIEVRVAPAGIVIVKVTPASTAERAGLRPGQVIVSIDGVAASTWSSSARGPESHAREYDIWRQAYRALHGASGSNAELRVREPAGTEKTVRVARGAEPGQVVQFGNLPPMRADIESREVMTPGGRKAGFIAFNLWMGFISGPIESAIDRYRKHDGLIIDLRGNPGGLATMMNGIAGYVFADPVLLGKMQTRTANLEFHANPRLSTPDGRRVTPFAGPVAIIVDELTASTSECFAGALQSLGRARIFGRQSSGQALPASTKQLPSGDVLMFVVGDFVTGTGKRLEGAGVTPDAAQPLSIESLVAGKDDALDAALQWLDGRRFPH